MTMDDAAFEGLVKRLSDVQHDYRVTLGYLIAEFANVEAEMQRTLWHYAKTAPAVSKVIFASLRTNETARFIRGILTATNSPDLGAMKEILDQLGIIRDVRNDLMHYGARLTPSSMQDEHLYIAHGEKYYPVRVPDLRKMALDLRSIRWRLQHLRDDVDAETELAWVGSPEKKEQALHGPWLYKPPEQPTAQKVGKADRKARRKQQHRP